MHKSLAGLIRSERFPERNSTNATVETPFAPSRENSG
jgi:hypothetical protein